MGGFDLASKPLAREQLFGSIAYLVTLMAVAAASRLAHCRLARNGCEQRAKVPSQLTPNVRINTQLICVERSVEVGQAHV